MNRKTFWLIVASFHFLFFAKQVLFSNSIVQDGVEYLLAADNLKNHQTLYAYHLNYAFNPDWLTKRPILYPSILLIFKYLSFGNQTFFFILIYLAQNILSIFNLTLAVKIAKKFNKNTSYSKALFFILLSISQAIYANMIMSEIWLQFCLIAILYVCVFEKMNVKSWLKIAILLVMGMSIKPVLILSAFLLPIIYLTIEFKKLKINRLLICLLPLLYYYAVNYINEKRTGYAHYSSISNINLLHYNAYVTLMNVYGTNKADSIVDAIKARASLSGNYKDKQVYIKNSGVKLIETHLLKYTYLHARGLIFALLDPGRYDLYQFFNIYQKHHLLYETNQKGKFLQIIYSFINPMGFILILIGLFNVFRLLVTFKFVISKSYKWPLKLLVLSIPVYILFMTGPIGSSRFFMPLIPFALVVFLLVRPKDKANQSDMEN